MVMYGMLTGFSDSDDIHFCPKCGSQVGIYFSDGTAKCESCGYHFGVIECEDDFIPEK